MCKNCWNVTLLVKCYRILILAKKSLSLFLSFFTSPTTFCTCSHRSTPTDISTDTSPPVNNKTPSGAAPKTRLSISVTHRSPLVSVVNQQIKSGVNDGIQRLDSAFISCPLVFVRP